MTQRFFHFTRYYLFAISIIACTLTPASVRAAEGIEIAQAHLENTEDGHKLSATFSFDLNRGLEEAITRGIPLYFTTDITLRRPRWYWFDETAVSTSQTIKIDYNVLTRQYHVGIVGSVQRSFSSLDDALLLIRRPNRWLIADRGTLKIGENYNVGVRMRLNLEFLPKTFQIHALNNSDWRLASDWKFFNFRAE